MQTMTSDAECPFRFQAKNSTYQISDRHFTILRIPVKHVRVTGARFAFPVDILEGVRESQGRRGAGSAGGAKRRRPAVLFCQSDFSGFCREGQSI
jgi:hypothetical protein